MLLVETRGPQDNGSLCALEAHGCTSLLSRASLVRTVGALHGHGPVPLSWWVSGNWGKGNPYCMPVTAWHLHDVVVTLTALPLGFLMAEDKAPWRPDPLGSSLRPVSEGEWNLGSMALGGGLLTGLSAHYAVCASFVCVLPWEARVEGHSLFLSYP